MGVSNSEFKFKKALKVLQKKYWMKNLEQLHLTSRSIEQWQPKNKKQTVPNVEKLKQSNKLPTIIVNILPKCFILKVNFHKPKYSH